MATVNKHRQLQELLKKSPILTGTVTAHNSDGTSTLSMTGGGVLIASGQSVAVAKVAFVQNQQILSEASGVVISYSLDV